MAAVVMAPAGATQQERRQRQRWTAAGGIMTWHKRRRLEAAGWVEWCSRHIS